MKLHVENTFYNRAKSTGKNYLNPNQSSLTSGRASTTMANYKNVRL